jgi:IS605 OrfB family transposase
MNITRAITHIRICDANHGKLNTLDQLAEAYTALCQQYVTYFCTATQPDKFAAPIFPSLLSQRWQRCAIQQAAGIARSWRTNHDHAYAEYHERLSRYEAQVQAGTLQPDAPAPLWHEWQTPHLKTVSIQANANVASLEAANTASFDYWLKVATLEQGRPVRLPIKLAAYHQRQLASHKPNRSVTLTRRADGSWWLTLTIDADVPTMTVANTEPVGADVGVANFVTASTGIRYGTFGVKLKRRLEYERAKRSRKAKLRACLKRKGVARLPSTQNQRLSRHVRQEINRSVNQFYADHPAQSVVIEKLAVASMRYKAKSLAVLIRASQLAHVPQQLKWGAAKRGIPIVEVNPAYSSQQCVRCWYTDRANRPHQEMFFCQACGYTAHADVNAAQVLAARGDDVELARCRSKEAVKQLLDARHAVSAQRQPVVLPPVQLALWGSTDAG